MAEALTDSNLGKTRKIDESQVYNCQNSAVISTWREKKHALMLEGRGYIPKIIDVNISPHM